MHCPKCKAKNKFKRDGKAVYCGRCFYTLTAAERLLFNKLQKKRDRKDYYKRYYHSKKKKYLAGISIREIAIIKFCSRVTVWKNKNNFDIIPGTKPMRFEFNDKILKWYPND